MTESERLGGARPDEMLSFLHSKVTERRLRLFAVACCRPIRHLLSDERSIRAVEVSEAFADGLMNQEELTIAHDAAHNAVTGRASQATRSCATPHAWIAADGASKPASVYARCLWDCNTPMNEGGPTGVSGRRACSCLPTG